MNEYIPIELDHLFILTESDTKAADCLLELGMEEGFSRVHKEQDITNRRFPFVNGMLEFLWVHAGRFG